MKRTKIMLTAIAVLAVAGGALAFKAKTFGARHYCYTFNTTDPYAECVLSATFRTFVPGISARYTTTVNPNLCSLAPSQLCFSIGALGGL